MKKYLPLLVCCTFLFFLTCSAFAVEVIIHSDEPNISNNPYVGGFVKDRAECMYVIEAEDGNKIPPYILFTEPSGNQHVWLYSGASVTVTCPEPTDVIYVQSSGSDRNDGIAEYYVDGVLVASINTWMRGIWYLEIRGLEETAHTVTFMNPGPADLNLDYFGFGDMPTYVDVDIKPGSCPNPLNVNEKCESVLPVAILGAEDFDVNTIDIASIRLAGVAPRCSRYEDVATPVLNAQNDCDCTTDGADGFVDLTLKFNKQEIIKAIGDANDGEVLQLILTGNLIDGKKIEGADCVKIIDKTPKKNNHCSHHGKTCSHHKKNCGKHCKKMCHKNGR
jgi:hypothetical protein